MNRALYAVGCVALFAVLAAPSSPPVADDATAQVMATERAFAKTMADRDFKAFATYVSEEAIFFTGAGPLRGKAAIVEYWKKFYEKPEAPFSWEPAQVEVLASGKLALSTGPVHDLSGKLTNTFSSIWRQEKPGVWRIVFDKGSPVCDTGTK
jgi:ketosteroid isomerase-like protein